MKECLIFVFDVSEVTPIVTHTIKCANICRELQIDRNMNVLTSLSDRGAITCL